VPQLHAAAIELYENHHLESLISREQMTRGADLAKINHILDAGNLSRATTLTNPEKSSILRQRSLKFWHDPKDVILTICCVATASYTQGWDQTANGNLGRS
jgi:hypothetical protein